MSNQNDSRRNFLTLSGAAVLSACGSLARAEEAGSNDNHPSEAENAVAGKNAAVKRSGLLSDPKYKEHLTGEGHPECPARYEAVTQALHRAGLDAEMEPLTARAANADELAAVHSREYLQIVHRDTESGAAQLSTGDTPLSPKSEMIAALAAGGILNAVDAVAQNKVKNAFCAVRPPGHHARPKQGMGFCIYNNAAVAARYAQQKHKLGKVLIVDWDVHHGNGTQDTFYEDGSVFYFSIHQHPWYPGTGRPDETGSGKGLGCTLNCPFPAGSGRKEILGAFNDKLLPAMNQFKPELVIISAGFDSREGDPLGRFTLSDDDFVDLTKLMLALAKEHAQGRLLSVLEGGYNLEGLALAATAHVKTLCST